MTTNSSHSGPDETLVDYLRELSIGYDLDTGGHSFEEAPVALGRSVVVWNAPDLDYMGLQDVEGAKECDLLAFAQNDGHFARHEFPAEFQDEDERYLKVAEGFLNETDHDCICHGKLAPWTGGPGESKEPLTPAVAVNWIERGLINRDAVENETGTETLLTDVVSGRLKLFFDHTGNQLDEPYPLCDRCRGDGYVLSAGGEWAFYRLEPTDP